MNVLSLFDGISVARRALDMAELQVAKYYACEIEKHAISISKKNYSSIIHLGSVVDLKKEQISEQLDLLIGGSPCQDLSIAKKERKGLDGERSGLFWEYVRLKNELKPKWFILENVASMPKKDKNIISEAMGCEPILFNASLVSAQCRKRLFWTNIPFTLPEDRGIILKDILQPDAEVDDRMIDKEKKAYTLTASYQKAVEKNSVAKKQRTMVKVGKISNSDSQANRVYSTGGKSCALSANGGGGGAKTGLYQITTNPKENKGLFITEDNKVAVIENTKKGFAIVEENNSVDLSFENSKTRRGRVGDKVKNLMTANNICVMVKSARIVGRRLNSQGNREDKNKEIKIEQQVEIRNDDKTGTLTSVQKDNIVINENFTIRKLTPIECERLQSLPDNYTEGIAMTNRYKVLGNAFNAEVVAHILKGINTP